MSAITITSRFIYHAQLYGHFLKIFSIFLYVKSTY